MEKETKVTAKLIDNISGPSKEVIKAIEELGDVTERNLLHLREALIEYYDGNETKAETHYKIILEELEVYHRTQETVIGDNLKGLLELYDGFYEKKLRKQMKAEDEGIRKIGEVEDTYQSLARAARRAQIAVDGLSASIAALESKTITITIITVRKTVYKTEGGSSGGSSSVSSGSNPYGAGGGSPTLSAAQAKVFTEQTVLPALKTLGREGKVEEIVH